MLNKIVMNNSKVSFVLLNTKTQNFKLVYCSLLFVYGLGFTFYSVLY